MRLCIPAYWTSDTVPRRQSELGAEREGSQGGSQSNKPPVHIMLDLVEPAVYLMILDAEMKYWTEKFSL